MTTHKSKIDRWLVVALGAATIALLTACVLAYRAESSPLRIMLALPIVLWALLWRMVLGIRYQLCGTELLISAPPFRWHITLSSITKISNTHSALSSPAGSLDRLLIEYSSKGKEKSLMISPSNKEAFVSDLIKAGATFTRE